MNSYDNASQCMPTIFFLFDPQINYDTFYKKIAIIRLLSIQIFNAF